jgi:hypothetical protein
MATEGSSITNNAASRASQTASRRLEGQVKAEVKRMRKSIRELERRIITEANKLRVSDMGLLVGPRVNLKQAQKMHTALTHMFEDIYGKQITAHVKGYKEVANWVLENFDTLDVAADFTDIDKAMIKQLNKQTVIEFTALGEQAKQRITQSLYNSIAAQAPFADFVGEISAALTGRLDKRGRPLSVHAELYANDAIMNFYNSVHIEKARSLGMRWLLYSGTIMANTRDFCSRRVGKAYSIAQINSWDHSWTGKRGSALVYRGGWNCRHHWQPVRKEWLEEKVVPKGKPMTSIGRLNNCVISR